MNYGVMTLDEFLASAADESVTDAEWSQAVLDPDEYVKHQRRMTLAPNAIDVHTQRLNNLQERCNNTSAEVRKLERRLDAMLPGDGYPTQAHSWTMVAIGLGTGLGTGLVVAALLALAGWWL